MLDKKFANPRAYRKLTSAVILAALCVLFVVLAFTVPRRLEPLSTENTTELTATVVSVTSGANNTSYTIKTQEYGDKISVNSWVVVDIAALVNLEAEQKIYFRIEKKFAEKIEAETSLKTVALRTDSKNIITLESAGKIYDFDDRALTMLFMIWGVLFMTAAVLFFLSFKGIRLGKKAILVFFVVFFVTGITVGLIMNKDSPTPPGSANAASWLTPAILISVAGAFAAFFLCARRTYKSVYTHHMAQNYDTALKKGLASLKWIPYKILRQNTYFMIADCCFNKNDGEKFDFYIAKVKQRDISASKYYLLAFDSLIKNNMTDAEKYYKEFLSVCDLPPNYPYELHKKVLFYVFSYLSDKSEYAKNELKSRLQESKNITIKNYLHKLLEMEQ
ncbi:MAG: hypothetical protein FWE62_02945 [Firmicutes bacterium]|nr:hypothetical protein [Bacillota bacterium]